MGNKKMLEELKKQGFYKNWPVKNVNHINFFICPDLNLEDIYFKLRSEILKSNADKLGVKKIPEINFFVYPSKKFGHEIGLELGFTDVNNR